MKTYTIKGKLTEADGKGINQTTIKVLNQKLRSQELLQSTVTNDSGSFELIIVSNSESLDLTILASIGETTIANSGVIINAKAEEEINLVRDNKTLVGQSKFHTYFEKIDKKLEGFNISELNEDEQTILSHKSGIAVSKIKLLAQAEQLSAEQGLSKYFAYSIIEAGLGTELTDLAAQPDSILQNTISKATKQNIIPEEEGTDTQITQQIDNLRTAAALQTLEKNSDNTSMYNRLRISKLKSKQKETFLKTLYKNSNNYSKTFEELEKDTDFNNNGQVADLKSIFEIGSITGNNTKMISTVKSSLDDDKKLSSYSVFSQSDWVKFIKEKRTSYPTGTDGKNWTQKVNNYAETLTRNFEHAFPGEKVQLKILDNNPGDDISSFLNHADDFNIGSTQINTYFKQKESVIMQHVADIDEVKKELKTYQRLYNITPDEDKYEKIEVLKQQGFKSASDIARKYTTQGFVNQFAEDLGGEENAKQTMSYVKSQQAKAAIVAAAVIDNVKGITPGVIKGKTNDSSDDKSIEIPDWETLFGTSSYCECEECRSVLSPAAYLVDLLEFINVNPDKNGKTPRDYLLDRRPDIGNILLSCDNTNIALPYIDLNIEVLEIAVMLIKGASTDDTHSKLVYDGNEIDIKYQTTGTTEELQSMPEHILSHVYDEVLNNKVYPFNLPFNFWNAEAEVYLNKIGYSRHEILRVLQYEDNTNDPSDIDVALVHLGFSENEKSVIAGAGVTIPDINKHDYYGYSSSDFDDELLNIETLLDVTGISYAELLLILQVSYLVYDNNVSISFDSDDCELSGAKLNIEVPRTFFDRLHRIIRLKNKLAWDFLILGKIIETLEPGLPKDFEDSFFIKLSNFKYLHEELNIDLDELISWFGLVSTVKDVNDSASRSHYELIFLNTAVSNPVEEVFLLDESDGTKLADESQNITDYKEAIAAGLNVCETDLNLLLEYLNLSSSKLTLENLSILYRHASAAKSFDLEIKEFLILLDILPVGPFKNLENGEPVDFKNYLEKINASDFSVFQLEYLFRHNSTSSDGIAPSNTEISSILKTIQASILSIKSENSYLSDPNGEVCRTKLEQVLSADISSQIIDIIHERTIYDETTGDPLHDSEKLSLLQENLTFLSDPVEIESNLLAIDSTISEEERIQKRYAYLLQPLLSYLIQLKSCDSLAQTFSDEFDIDLDIATLMVSELVLSPGDSELLKDVFIADDFLAYDFASDGSIDSDLNKQFETLLLFNKSALIIAQFGFNNLETQWIYENGASIGWLDLNKLTVELTEDVAGKFDSWYKMYCFSVLNDKFRSDDILMIDILGNAIARRDALSSPVPLDLTELSKWYLYLAELTGWNADDIIALTKSDCYDYSTYSDMSNGLFFYKIYEIVEFLENCGVSAQTLWSWAKPDLSSTNGESDSIKKACKAKYTTNEWLSVAPELRNKLRPLQRDTLLGYIIAYNELSFRGKDKLEDENDVLDYYLIDVLMESDFLTARIKQACSSVQMFINNCFMGLELDITLDDELKEQWEWMRYYRYWEANRKVFLWPENWLEPELRMNKTEIFEEFESELLQNEINDENIERGLIRYLEELKELSNIVICATVYNPLNSSNSTITSSTIQGIDEYSTKKDGILYVFGRTQNDPYEYFLRQYDYSKDYWTAWEKIDLDIDSASLTPVIFNGRLHLFWLVFNENSMTADDFVNNFSGKAPLNNLFVNTEYFVQNIENRDNSYKYFDISVAFSTYKYDKWTAKKISTESISTANIKTAVKFYDSNTILEKNQFFLQYKTYEDNIEFKLIQFTKSEDIELKKIAEVISLSEWFSVYSFSFWDEMHKADRNEYEYENGSFIYYEPDPDLVEIENYHRIGKFLFRPEDLNIYVSSTNVYTYEMELPNDPDVVTTTIKETETNYNLIIGGSQAKSLWLPVFSSTTDKEIFKELQSEFLIPLNNSENGIFYQNDFFFSDKESQRRFFGINQNTVFLGESNLDFLTKRPPYKFVNVYIPFITDLLSLYLTSNDYADLFGREFQIQSDSGSQFEDLYLPSENVTTPYPELKFDFSYGNPSFEYLWEFFFHMPVLIADYLTQENRFEEAQKWLHFIFNPLDSSSESSPQKYWQIKPFFEESVIDSIRDLMYALSYNGTDSTMVDKKTEIEKQILAWLTDPFEPHVIAALRISAYMKNVVMRYLDNLIAWGDDLFSRDTIESINEATQIYVLAYRILGDRPIEIPAKSTADYTYYDLSPDIDAFSNALIEEIETYTSADSGVVTDQFAPMVISNLTSSLYFCVPFNSNLLTYWDRIEDRLFKIRNSMNLNGVTRSLSLYEPPIDPMLLIKAKAAGIDLGTILSNSFVSLPNYRFRFYVQKAIQFCNDLQNLGGSILSAMEKQDTEELALIRGVNEINLLQAALDIKEFQIDEAKESYESLLKSKELTEAKIKYYETIEEISPKESKQLDKLKSAHIFSQSATGTEAMASVLFSIPQFHTGTMGITTETGGQAWGNTAKAAASVLRGISAQYSYEANKLSINAAYERRKEEWKLQEDLANLEKEQIEIQITAAEIRKSITEKDLENTEIQIEQSNEVYEWMTNKYTNKELYKWILSQLSSLYYKSYQLAVDVGKRAQRAFQFELSSDQTFIEYGYWDSQKKGLLAGEKLLYDLKRMEMAYYEQNKRQFEITKNISLAQLDPMALINLKTGSECFINIPEIVYDLDYAGHYQRRIKSVSLTIPCVMGPYTNLSCTLTLMTNKFRYDPSAAESYSENTDMGYDPRFKYNLASVQSIATSSALNDSGVFQLNFEDERYLPFEGAGSISSWRIQLPSKFKAFDYNTIQDVIIQIKYTAKDGGELLKQKAEAVIEDSINAIVSNFEKTGLTAMFSLSQDFSNDWYRFLNPSEGATEQEISMNIDESKFPFIFREYLTDNDNPITGITLIKISKATDDTETIILNLSTPEGDVLEITSNKNLDLSDGSLGVYKLSAAKGTITSDSVKDIFILVSYKLS